MRKIILTAILFLFLGNHSSYAMTLEEAKELKDYCFGSDSNFDSICDTELQKELGVTYDFNTKAGLAELDSFIQQQESASSAGSSVSNPVSSAPVGIEDADTGSGLSFTEDEETANARGRSDLDPVFDVPKTSTSTTISDNYVDAAPVTGGEDARKLGELTLQYDDAKQEYEKSVQAEKDLDKVRKDLAAANEAVEAAKNNTSWYQFGETKEETEAIAKANELRAKQQALEGEIAKKAERKTAMDAAQKDLTKLQGKYNAQDQETKAYNESQKNTQGQIENLQTQQGYMEKTLADLNSIKNPTKTQKAEKKNIEKALEVNKKHQELLNYYKAEDIRNSTCSKTDTKCKELQGELSALEYDQAKVAAAYSQALQSELAGATMNLCDYGICIGNVTSIENIAENVIRFLARVIAILAVLAFMVGGFLMMIRVDDEGRESAKKIMVNSVIAVVVVLAAYVIVTFIQQVLYSLGA